MTNDSKAWGKMAEADDALRAAQRKFQEAKIRLVEIRKAKALADLAEYPQHANIILDELVNGVVNIMRVA